MRPSYPPRLALYMFINAKMDSDTCIRALTGCRPDDPDYPEQERAFSDILRRALADVEHRQHQTLNQA